MRSTQSKRYIGLGLLAVLMLWALLLAACGAAATPVVVEKQVVKEVPVERVVEKVVTKEVPVERVVERVVTKEVVKPPARLASITVTDVAGRTVTVKQPVERMLLGEGRHMYVIGALEKEDPFKKVVGWVEDLQTADLDSYNKYKTKYPQVPDIPQFGNMFQGAFSVEKAIALKPDVVTISLGSLTRSEGSGLISQLDKAGIPAVVIDFREFPLENTVPSTFLLGRLLGQEQRAQEMVDFYAQQMNLIRTRLDQLDAKKAPKPTVFIWRGGGAFGDCCATFGKGNLGLLVEKARGNNLGSTLLPGGFGEINPEQVIVSNPDRIIATGSNWIKIYPKGGYVRLGYEATRQESQAQLKDTSTKQPGWANLQAVKSGKFDAVWHQFYNNPYHFAALQQFAKWMYPDEFRDLNPEQTLREFHERFLPIEYSGLFWVSLEQ